MALAKVLVTLSTAAISRSSRSGRVAESSQARSSGVELHRLAERVLVDPTAGVVVLDRHHRTRAHATGRVAGRLGAHTHRRRQGVHALQGAHGVVGTSVD